VTHISLSDPVTWVGILVASLLIAGLRWIMRGGARPPPPTEADRAEDEPKTPS
jgi:hypothetical protein